jgi:hypothetical protein
VLTSCPLGSREGGRDGWIEERNKKFLDMTPVSCFLQLDPHLLIAHLVIHEIRALNYLNHFPEAHQLTTKPKACVLWETF